MNSCGLINLGAEIGVYTGRFSKTILSHWSGRMLYLVDPWKFQSDYIDSWNAPDRVMQIRYRTTLKRLSAVHNRITIIRKRSIEASYEFAPGSLDFIYIDANHSFKHVKDDLHAWYSKLIPGGLFCGHDYFNALSDEDGEPIFGSDAPREQLTSYGVKAAVDDFASEVGVRIQATMEKFSTWYFHKP